MPPLYCHKNRASPVGSPPAGLAPFFEAVSPVPPPDLSIKRALKSSPLACAWSNFVHAPAPPYSLVIKFRSRTSSLLLICHQILIRRQLIFTHTWSNFVHASSNFDHAPASPYSCVIKIWSHASLFLLVCHQILITWDIRNLSRHRISFTRHQNLITWEVKTLSSHRILFT